MDELLRRHAEGCDELAMQLPGREPGLEGEVFDGERLADVRADVVHGAGKAGAAAPGLPPAFLSLVGPDEAHDADDGSGLVADGEFRGDEPVEHAAVVEPRLEPVEQGLA